MQIVYGGGEAFTAAIVGSQNPVNRQYFLSQLEQAKSHIGDSFGSLGASFISGMQRMYDTFNSSRAIELTKAALNQITGVFQADVIRTISDISHFQIATPIMQRYIMANPIVRQMYHDQRLDGYSDTYVDTDPGVVGEKHYDYRRVMSGIMVPEGTDLYYTSYIEQLRDEQDELTAGDQFRILDTWANIENLILSGGKDPTSPWNADM